MKTTLKDSKVLVFGAGGFLGSTLVKRLIQEGAKVSAADLNQEALAVVADLPVTTVACDIRDSGQVLKVCAGKDYVFNSAAMVAHWGSRDAFWSVNVRGTDNIIEACRRNKVKRLIHVSSPSAIFDGKDHFDVDESAPYPRRFLNYYCETKAVSEQRVQAADGTGIETVSIRPHAIWGPGDRHLLPRIVKQARTGRLMQIGNGENLVSTVYVDNAVQALLKAATSPKAPGKIYFVTDGVPVKIWDFTKKVLQMLNLPEIKRAVPFFLADVVASAMESGWGLLQKKDAPVITRYVVAELAKNHTYSIENARNDLDYEPVVTIEEGLKRVKLWAREQGI